MTGWAVLAAGALVASLLAVGAGPAAALDEDSKPDKPAATSACVGEATGDQMFSDVSEMHTFRADINCLAYYGVTIGYGDGTFQPDADVSREEMVLFMERAAAAAGADAEKVVGDFATTGSDPVNRGDMALLIARLLVAATTDESAVNVKNATDGTFTVDGVTGKDWDYFADSRRSQNRVKDSAASALYELGVAKGTGMGYFSPGDSVSRGAMAAFITRALAHTTARPEGVTIQSDNPGEVIISVRDANFHPVANAAVDVFSAAANKVDEVFKADGTCHTARLTGENGNTMVCQIDALDEATGLSGDVDFSVANVNVKAGGTTVWAWTGDQGDKVEDGGAGLAHINLTETAPVTAAATKVTTDMTEHSTRVHFGRTVTVTIQLVGDEASNRADAAPPTGGASYTVTIRRFSESNVRGDVAPVPVTVATAQGVETKVLKVDASGKATFEITASDPDPTDRNNPIGADAVTGPPAVAAIPNKIDRTTVTFTVATGTGGLTLEDTISSTDSSGMQTIHFSDERGVMTRGSIKPTVDFLMRPATGSAGNAVIVNVVDQYGGPIRGHLVRLSTTHDPTGPTSTVPIGRRTDSSGSVRIGYTYTGTGSVEALVANTAASVAADAALEAITGATASIYWAAPPAASTDETTAAASGTVVAVDLDQNTIIVSTTGSVPLLVTYDENDQYSVGASGSEASTTMAAFEEALTADGAPGTTRNDMVVVTSYNPNDSSDVARFVLTVAPG